MLKFGLVNAAQLAHPRTLLGAQKFPSVLLLGDPQATDDQRNNVLRMVQMANGTWKDSRAGRLRVLDEAILRVLRDSRTAGSALRVLDLGVASGITSVELDDTLATSFEVETIATDLWRDSVAVHAPQGWTIVFDVRGNVLQHIVGRFVLPGQSEESPLYVVNRLLRWWSSRHWVPAAAAVLAAYDPAAGDFETRRIDGYEVTKVPLLSAACLRRCADNPRFRFEVLDVLQPFPIQADLIRGMNLLTPHHLGEAQLRIAIGHCLRALRPGGLLVVGRSLSDDPQDVGATIFRRDGSKLSIAERLNAGAEIEALVVDLAGWE